MMKIPAFTFIFIIYTTSLQGKLLQYSDSNLFLVKIVFNVVQLSYNLQLLIIFMFFSCHQPKYPLSYSCPTLISSYKVKKPLLLSIVLHSLPSWRDSESKLHILFIELSDLSLMKIKSSTFNGKCNEVNKTITCQI